MPRYKAVISYDGSAFYGFALQKHKPSVLGVFARWISTSGDKERDSRSFTARIRGAFHRTGH